MNWELCLIWWTKTSISPCICRLDEEWDLLKIKECKIVQSICTNKFCTKTNSMLPCCVDRIFHGRGLWFRADCTSPEWRFRKTLRPISVNEWRSLSSVTQGCKLLWKESWKLKAWWRKELTWARTSNLSM